eukprot:CAMPEP_0184867636 /NCGR_PEP_ID=MMETSP0580-20130426/27377_1 /TAXON_ID=1118495 /ORGANISM="Dactyliosolen fragilissimus" /LENGTH=354 /DNA_ID=CAMNT_0027368051 /DNA_START=1 /DNA_END=1061 /DNA_ORIENTATION=-
MKSNCNCYIISLLILRTVVGSTILYTPSSSRAAFYKSVNIASPTESSSTASSSYLLDERNDGFYHSRNDHDPEDDTSAKLCSASVMRMKMPPVNPVIKNLFRGAFLRVASDISGGTPLENIKCRVTATYDGPVKAFRDILKEGGIMSLWSGTESRTVEGALLGAMFLVGSASTKKQIIAMGGSKTMGALAGGVVGGVVQALVMTPAGLVFTSLNVNKGKPGYENDTALTVARRVVEEKGIMALFTGGGPMAARQASNWASRSLFTEICRTNLKLSRFGILGEIGSGAIGGLGSCWNTPIETVRVFMQRDVARGEKAKTFNKYISETMEEDGFRGLYRGVSPRAVQAIWQTCFLV